MVSAATESFWFRKVIVVWTFHKILCFLGFFSRYGNEKSKHNWEKRVHSCKYLCLFLWTNEALHHIKKCTNMVLFLTFKVC